MTSPLAWRERHDDFAVAARALRRTVPQGPAPEAVAALGDALGVHAASAEGVLGPRYAEVAPPEGPGSLRALARDHGLLVAHLARAADPDPLVRAWALSRLEGVLEHHDLREGTHVLPALERLGVKVDVVEPTLAEVALVEAASDGAMEAVAVDRWPEALARLAEGVPVRLPEVAEHPKAQRLQQAYDEALACLGGPRAARRDALAEAFDRALELAWLGGEAQAPWMRRLRGDGPEHG